MYPSSSSSSSQGSMGPTAGSGGLIRYGSAPGSFLAAVDSAVGSNRDFSNVAPGSQIHPHAFMSPSRYFPSETSSLTSESACKVNVDCRAGTGESSRGGLQLHGPYGVEERAVGEFTTASNLKSTAGGPGSSSSSHSPSLVRHSSSPAGFLNHLTATGTSADNGFSVARGMGNYNSKNGSSEISRLNSQLSFTRQDRQSLSHITEEVENPDHHQSQGKTSHSYANPSFVLGPWDDTNDITFSPPSSKRAKNISNNDIVNAFSTMDQSQFQFSMSQSALEMATVENLLNIPQDSVPCKIRAKRGCATHPRSIAERERRTRISGKLKKLQDLVPNMDKQTSYADMLDLAVKHIKGLQNQVEKLHCELENCTCGCKHKRS